MMLLGVSLCASTPAILMVVNFDHEQPVDIKGTQAS
jgi:hypothetical protein